jgi:hypothetical protein
MVASGPVVLGDAKLGDDPVAPRSDVGVLGVGTSRVGGDEPVSLGSDGDEPADPEDPVSLGIDTEPAEPVSLEIVGEELEELDEPESLGNISDEDEDELEDPEEPDDPEPLEPPGSLGDMGGGTPKGTALAVAMPVQATPSSRPTAIAAPTICFVVIKVGLSVRPSQRRGYRSALPEDCDTTVNVELSATAPASLPPVKPRQQDCQPLLGIHIASPHPDRARVADLHLPPPRDPPAALRLGGRRQNRHQILALQTSALRCDRDPVSALATATTLVTDRFVKSAFDQAQREPNPGRFAFIHHLIPPGCNDTSPTRRVSRSDGVAKACAQEYRYSLASSLCGSDSDNLNKIASRPKMISAEQMSNH